MTSKIKTKFWQGLFLFALCLLANNIFAADGDLDTSFGTGGIVTATLNNLTGQSMVLQPDGKIVVASTARILPNPNDFGIARFNANGSLDTTFGTNGTTVTDFNNSGDSVSKVLLQPDGKFVVTGFAGFSYAAARYNSNGTLDTTFGTNGRVITSFGVGQLPIPSGATLQSDGKIVLFGSRCSGCANEDIVLIRLNTNGTTDTSFGTNGRVITDFNNVSNPARSIAIQSDGKILVGGNLFVGNNQTVPILVRYNDNGTLDNTFATNGKLEVTAFTGVGSEPGFLDLAVRPNGKIIAAGIALGGPDGTIANIALVQINPDGTLDGDFGTGGTVKKQIILPTPTNPRGSIDRVSSVYLQTDGKIVVGVTHTPEIFTRNDFAIARFNANGATDNTFGTTGIKITPINTAINSNDFVNDTLIQPDGKIILSGFYQDGGVTPLALVRYLATSNPRRAFDFDGDGKADISVFRPSNTVWYASKSSDSQVLTAQWGIASDKIMPADYNGDGKTDYAVFRDGFWYVLLNGGGFEGAQWGSVGDIPFPADFDADGKADLAVFRNGTWFVRKSTGGTITQNWGSVGDIPVVADYDADGKADFAVYRNGIWYVLKSTGGDTAVQWGIAGDKTVQGDYNGDNKADYAVFRNGFWYILLNGGGFIGAQWGQSGDIASPADYDGDGRTDLAVFRAGTWYIQRTTAGVQVVTFGSAGDRPVPNAFVP